MAEVKKKHHVGLTIFIIILIIIALPIAFVYAFCFDLAKHDPNIPEADIGKVVNGAVVKSFTSTKTTGKLHLEVTQDDLNGVFKKVYNGMDQTAKQYVKGIYVEASGNNYDFFIEGDVPAFSTRVIINTTLNEVKNATAPLEGSFQFKINKISIARFGWVIEVVKTFAASSLKDLGITLQNAIKNSGLSLTVDLENLVINYKKADVLKDASAMLNNQALFADLLSDFFSKDLVSLGQAQNALSFDTDLTSLHTNKDYVVLEDSLNLDLAAYNTKLVTLLNGGIADPAQNNLPSIQQYLIRGYDGVGDSIRNIVKDLDLTSIGITDYQTYKGADLEAGKADIKASMATQALANLPKFAVDHVVGSISEAQLNSMLHASGLIGSGFAMTLNNSTTGKDYTNVYIVFNDVTAQIVNDHIYFSLAVSLNGYDVRFVVTTKIDATEAEMASYRIGLKIENLYFGSQTVSETLKADIYKYLTDAFAGNESISYANNRFVIDFSGSISPAIDTAIKVIGKPNAKLIGTSLTDAGAKLELGITPNI